MLVLESPTNPTLEIVDLAAACAAAATRAALVVVVDNTFASPHLQRPLALGADLVMHSLTKTLAGHSDLIAGALAGSRERIDAARATMKVLGGCLDPHAAFLALRGVKTLHLRVERQCANALALARALEGHPRVQRVLYPGLPSHPGHALAAPADVGLRRDRDPRARGRAARGRALLRSAVARRARGEPRRRRVAREPAGAHVALRPARREAAGGGHRPRAWSACRWASRTRTTSSRDVERALEPE